MAHTPGFTEEKTSIISKLHKQVEEDNEKLNSAQVGSTNADKSLADVTVKYQQNEDAKTAADTSAKLAGSLVLSAAGADKLAKKAVTQSAEIVKGVSKQLEDAYKSALITIDAAHETMQLTHLISKTKVTHKLLSDLLIVDVKNAETDAHGAVADTIAAVSASLSAVKSAVLANEYLTNTHAQTSTLVDKLSKGDALKSKLDSYYQTVNTAAAGTQKSYNTAGANVAAADEKLSEAKAHLDLATAAYNAALAAVSPAS